MRIILNQEEIEEAIEKLILEQVDVPDDFRIDIDLKATRGNEGYTAEIDLVHYKQPEGSRGDKSEDDAIKPVPGEEDLGIAQKVLAAKAEDDTPRRRGRPPGSKNRPKTVATDANELKPAEEIPAAEVEQTPVTPAEATVTPGSTTETEAETPAPDMIEEAVSQPEPLDPIQEQTDSLPQEATQEAPQKTTQEPVQDEPQSEPEAEQVSDTQPVEEAPVSEPEPVNEPTEQPVEEQPVAEPVEEEAPAPAPTVSQSDVSGQSNEQLAESMSQPEPEEAPAQTETSPAPTRSLFANLGR